MDKKEKVVQLSSAHSNFDNRIFNKISKSLASHGYDVDLIIQHSKDETVDGVNIKALPIVGGRLRRITKILPRLFFKCIDYPPRTIFHFHDPELILVGLLLKLFGYRVIYDIHEDYAEGVHQKKYLPQRLKQFFLSMATFFESLAYKNLYTIIAERYYEERFPESLKVLNYPIIEWAKNLKIERKNPTNILYTGSITFDRGAVNHIDLLGYLDSQVKLKMVGVCAFPVYEKLRELVEPDLDRLEIVGVSRLVPFNEIIHEYEKEEWLAGMAIFPKSKFYERKHLTKFFEYMAAGLPIIYSDFPEWKELLGPLNVGISVNPDCPIEAVEAIKKLKESPQLRVQMAKNGREAVFNSYNWKNEEEKLLSFYKEIESSA